MLTTSMAINTELGTEGVDYADSIRQWSAAIESYCGREFGERGLEDVFRLQAPRPTLMLTAYPVSSISAVVEAGTTLAEGDYEADADAGILTRLRGDFVSLWRPGKITVAYQAGYVLPSDDAEAEPSTLPADIERCCIELVARAVQSQGRDPALRSYESPDVETITFMDADKIVMKSGLPADIATRLDQYRVPRL